MKKKITNKFDDIYSLIYNEEDARACRNIRESACKYFTANYFLIIISNTLTKLGDALSNPKTVLTWLMNYVNAPLYLIGFLVPIRESGSMIPQILIANYVRKIKIRKWVWVLGAGLQFLSIAGIGFSALSFEGTTAGWLIILFLIVFSLSRGLSSVSSKDVMGKTIPKKRRGRLNGVTTSISGILILIAGFYITFKTNENVGVEFYSYLIFFAASLWLCGALVYANIKEYPGETEGGKSGIKEALGKLKLLKTDKPFRNFVISRALLLCSALTAPYYVILAQTYLIKDSYLLGLFILANGIASSVSAPFWGKMADISSKKVMSKAAIITSLLGFVISFIVKFMPDIRSLYWLYPLAFFVLGISHSGVRLGRKTYIIDMAGGNKRTDYVSVSNTLIGVILLLTGGIGALATFLSPEFIILILSTFGAIGAYTSSKLPNV